MHLTWQEEGCSFRIKDERRREGVWERVRRRRVGTPSHLSKIEILALRLVTLGMFDDYITECIIRSLQDILWSAKGDYKEVLA